MGLELLKGNRNVANLHTVRATLLTRDYGFKLQQMPPSTAYSVSQLQYWPVNSVET